MENQPVCVMPGRVTFGGFTTTNPFIISVSLFLFLGVSFALVYIVPVWIAYIYRTNIVASTAFIWVTTYQAIIDKSPKNLQRNDGLFVTALYVLRQAAIVVVVALK